MKTMMPALALAALELPLARATDPPTLKEGLWSIHTQSIDNPGAKKSEGTYTLCRDHAYDTANRARAKTVQGCTTVHESFQGGKYSTEIHCVIGGTAIESKATTTFQGDVSSHTEGHSTYTPVFNGVSETTTVMDQKYVGSCPAGVQPGDRIGADGKVIHSGKH